MIRSKAAFRELIDSGEFIVYIRAERDDRYPNVSWSVVGDARYDLLWVVLICPDGETQFVECVKSVVQSPMSERTAGIDEADAGLAQLHIEDMWNKYKDRLPK